MAKGNASGCGDLGPVWGVYPKSKWELLSRGTVCQSSSVGRTLEAHSVGRIDALHTGDLATMASANALFMAALSDDDRLARLPAWLQRCRRRWGHYALSASPARCCRSPDCPSFAVVLYEGGHQLRLLVRGRLVVELAYSDGRVEQVQGDRARTWREELVDDVIG